MPIKNLSKFSGKAKLLKIIILIIHKFHGDWRHKSQTKLQSRTLSVTWMAFSNGNTTHNLYFVTDQLRYSAEKHVAEWFFVLHTNFLTPQTLTSNQVTVKYI